MPWDNKSVPPSSGYTLLSQNSQPADPLAGLNMVFAPSLANIQAQAAKELANRGRKARVAPRQTQGLVCCSHVALQVR